MARKQAKALFVLSVVCTLIGNYTVNAYAAEENLAISAGKDFGDGVNTIQDAKDASKAYEKAGFKAITITNPQKSSFTTEYLHANVLFLSGHGNENVLSFGNNFKFACQSGTLSDIYMNLWDTVQYQSLITFAGCNTAGGDKQKGSTASTSSITERAVEQGATVAVGWTSTVGADSHTNWLKRYNNALANGQSVSQAITTANSYIYLPGSGVKNVVYYGDGDLTLRSVSSNMSESSFNKTQTISKKNLRVLNEIKSLALNNSQGFNTENLIGYVYKTNNGLVVDAYYKCGEIVTNNAITLHLGMNGEIIGYKIHNITVSDLSLVPMTLANKSIQRASQSVKLSIADVERASIDDDDTILHQEQFEYYDTTSGLMYLVTYTEVIDDIGAKYVKENLTLIN